MGGTLSRAANGSSPGAVCLPRQGRALEEGGYLVDRSSVTASWPDINKSVTPHLLRHTAATQLLFNGCPVGHIKEILGHERLETTCRYYLGLDHRAAKQAHQRYPIYSAAAELPLDRPESA